MNMKTVYTMYCLDMPVRLSGLLKPSTMSRLKSTILLSIEMDGVNIPGLTGLQYDCPANSIGGEMDLKQYKNLVSHRSVPEQSGLSQQLGTVVSGCVQEAQRPS